VALQIDSEQQWANSQFGKAQLGDARRTRRLVQVACAMAMNPQASIPDQHGDWAGAKGAYRLFSQDQITFESVSQSHWDQTRLTAGDCDVTLMIQDTTYLSYTDHPATEGLGRLVNKGSLGLLLHSVLAVEPRSDGSGRVLGVAHGQLWARDGEVTGQGPKRNQKRGTDDLESLRWGDAVQQVGAASPGKRFVHVGDRESDIFNTFQQTSDLPGVGFVIRLMKQRNASMGHHHATLSSAQRPKTALKEICRQMKPLGTMRLWIPPRGGRPGRSAKLAVTGGAVTIYSPWFGHGGSRTARPLRCWAVRVWELDPPAGQEGLEWMLLTSEAVDGLSDAVRICNWYSLRWMIEEYHQCLKSGCRVEQRQLEDADRLGAFIGIATAVAARLLQLKNEVREAPDQAAMQCVSNELVQTLAKLKKIKLKQLNIRRFTHEVAKMGGFLGRKGDGEPAWKTLWIGWRKLNLIVEGYRLAMAQRRCG
jgi:hypothetical protein